MGRGVEAGWLGGARNSTKPDNVNEKWREGVRSVWSRKLNKGDWRRGGEEERQERRRGGRRRSALRQITRPSAHADVSLRRRHDAHLTTYVPRHYSFSPPTPSPPHPHAHALSVLSPHHHITSDMVRRPKRVRRGGQWIEAQFFSGNRDPRRRPWRFVIITAASVVGERSGVGGVGGTICTSVGQRVQGDGNAGALLNSEPLSRRVRASERARPRSVGTGSASRPQHSHHRTDRSISGIPKPLAAFFPPIPVYFLLRPLLLSRDPVIPNITGIVSEALLRRCNVAPAWQVSDTLTVTHPFPMCLLRLRVFTAYPPIHTHGKLVMVPIINNSFWQGCYSRMKRGREGRGPPYPYPSLSPANALRRRRHAAPHNIEHFTHIVLRKRKENPGDTRPAENTFSGTQRSLEILDVVQGKTFVNLNT
ncbi:hypothetical protein O3P69_007434 [Scylla paramamosain]|uniref:Uncharacterized protein n=1 Tax=Scylla paramamosain TaxID=85552 RepID=A0AAW0V7L8_SCYPA